MRPPSELAIPSFDLAFEKCASNRTGRDYISSVSKLFLKTANLDSCILKGDPIHKPISIYFDLDSVGKIGDIIIRPNSLLSYCIKENVSQLALPPPPKSECVVRILVSFGDEVPPQDDEASD